MDSKIVVGIERSINGSNNSDDLFGNDSYTAEKNDQYTSFDSLSDEDVMCRRKKVIKVLNISSDSSYSECVSANDNSLSKSLDLNSSKPNRSSLDFDSFCEEKYKRYIFGEANINKDQSHYSTKNITVIDESINSSCSILDSSKEFSFTHSTLKDINVGDSVKKAKSLLSNVLLNNTKNIRENSNLTKSLSTESDKINENERDKFTKVLDDTTNIMKNNFCVTPKYLYQSNDNSINPTPRKKLFNRNNGSFDDKENISNDKIMYNSTPKTFRKSILESLRIGANFENSKSSEHHSKLDSLQNFPAVTNSPLVRNESKRRKVNNKLLVPSEFKLDEYANSPIHKVRDCENYFTDSDTDNVSDYENEESKEHKTKYETELNDKYSKEKTDLTAKNNIYVGKTRDCENYFTDSEADEEHEKPEEANLKYEEHNYLKSTFNNSSVTEIKDCENYNTDTEGNIGQNYSNNSQKSGRNQDASFKTESDFEDSFHKLLVRRKKMKVNPLNYSSDVSTEILPEDESSKIGRENLSTDENAVQDYFISRSRQLEITSRWESTLPNDDATKNVNNSTKILEKDPSKESRISNNSDLVSSIFLDSSFKNTDTNILSKTKNELNSLQLNSVANKTSELSESVINIDMKKETEVINVSSSDDDVSPDNKHFHNDSFDIDKYFQRIRAENETAPCEKNKLEDIISNIAIPSYSSNVEHTSFLLSLSSEVEDFMCHPEAKKFKTSFQKCKDELVAVLYKMYNIDIFDNKLPIIKITWSGHLTTTAGLTHSNSRINEKGIKERKSSIKLSKTVTRDAAKLRDVLLHEMCHVANWLIDEQSEGHGPLFKKWANKAWQRYPDIPKVSKCHRYELNYKYKYRCTFCGTEVGRMKLTVKEFSCRLCGGRVTVDCK